MTETQVSDSIMLLIHIENGIPQREYWDMMGITRVLEVITIFLNQEVFPQAIFLFSLEHWQDLSHS